MRIASRVVNPLDGIAAEPYRHDFFAAMRAIEAHHAHLPRLGHAKRPADEPIRLGQHPDLAFAPAALSGVKYNEHGVPPRLELAFFGLFGPNGALPIHLTDHARERILHHGDETTARFADLFHHRLGLLFYRAWAQAQPTASLDRPGDDRFAQFVGSLIGLGESTLQHRDEAPDHSKLYYAGHYARQTRNAEGLENIVSGYLKLPVKLESFVGHWMTLPESERTRLRHGQHPSAQLGRGAVAGRQVFDRQHKFRLHIGPLDLPQFESLLPDRPTLHAVRALVRQYVGQEFEWDVRLHLKRDQVPATRPGSFGRLGWTTWSGRWQHPGDADSFTFNPETSGKPRAARAPVTQVTQVTHA
jgi:type VI secretion system protein ImpH